MGCDGSDAGLLLILVVDVAMTTVAKTLSPARSQR